MQWLIGGGGGGGGGGRRGLLLPFAQYYRTYSITTYAN